MSENYMRSVLKKILKNWKMKNLLSWKYINQMAFDLSGPA
jgi:hypothetical protein